MARRAADGAWIGPQAQKRGPCFESVATVMNGGAETLLAVADGGDAGEAGVGGNLVVEHGAAPF